MRKLAFICKREPTVGFTMCFYVRLVKFYGYNSGVMKQLCESDRTHYILPLARRKLLAAYAQLAPCQRIFLYERITK